MVKMIVIGVIGVIAVIFGLLFWMAEIAERRLPPQGEFRIEAVNVGGIR